ncbi:MAG: hypothetical protein A3F35_01540 [Candidatus Woykebacteria bacterium RIFCSPHIGHO2_12_FULL_45_10]|uniref:Cupin type-2 domain-containing protein n=1 Tax=Candidatus Woykebacteria bacterium RIFCSPHIGHO2_12_FULL_45_10 TaxID=1802603 RepID=A0A1G1WNW8_9BACT|nr:MAG: hypothetical protein A3F35_01540 [Candidatus Woykebacteria bacterium RIFCSPHIGHO2_12_FULL_45_10]
MTQTTRHQLLDRSDNPTEIICELPKTSGGFSTAIAVVESSVPHLHKETTEKYEVLKGELKLTVEGRDYQLKEGDKFVIEPNKTHFAQGKETWVKVTSTPPWSSDDQILI